jgi:beta-lactamase class A
MVTQILVLLAAAMVQPSGLRAQIEQISRASGGRVGAAIMVVETGETVAFHGGQRFPMQSVYKFPIGMAVLHDVDAGRLSLEQRVRVEESDLLPAPAHSPIRDQYPHGGADLSLRELMRFMITESDGTASDVLLRLTGGPPRVSAYLGELGVKEIVVATSEKEMGRSQNVQYRNWASPIGMVSLLRAFHEGRGLSAPSRTFLLELMTQTAIGAHRIKGLLPSGTVVAHKTGTSGTNRGLTRATNDVGLITLPDGRHLAVAVFVSDSTANDEVREGVIAKIARAAWDWSQRSH